jgi:hypothetical protein
MKKKQPKVVGGLSAAEIAKLTNVSVSRIYTQLSQGRTPYEILLAAQRRKEQQAARAVSVLPAALDIVAPLNGGGGHVNGSVPSYAASLAKKEAMLAELRSVELAEKRRELLPVSYFRHWGTKFLIEAKNLWLRGPSELADELAAECDPRKCESIVRRFCEQVVGRIYELERLWSPEPPPEADAA